MQHASPGRGRDVPFSRKLRPAATRSTSTAQQRRAPQRAGQIDRRAKVKTADELRPPQARTASSLQFGGESAPSPQPIRIPPAPPPHLAGVPRRATQRARQILLARRAASSARLARDAGATVPRAHGRVSSNRVPPLPCRFFAHSCAPAAVSVGALKPLRDIRKRADHRLGAHAPPAAHAVCASSSSSSPAVQRKQSPVSRPASICIIVISVSWFPASRHA